MVLITLADNNDGAAGGVCDTCVGTSEFAGDCAGLSTSTNDVEGVDSPTGTAGGDDDDADC